MDHTSRVIDVHTYRREPEVRRMFSKCGKIRAMYPWTTGRTNKYHYFIEYSTEEAADHAKLEYTNVPDIQVHSLKLNVGMQERYRTLAAGKEYVKVPALNFTRFSTEAKWSTPHDRFSGGYKGPRPRLIENDLVATRQVPSYSDSDYDNTSSQDIILPYSVESPKSDYSSTDVAEYDSSKLSNISSSSYTKDFSELSPDATLQGSEIIKDICLTESKFSNAPTSLSFSQASPIKSSMIRVPSTSISLMFSSEIINCDLDKFVSDPLSIITLLKESRTSRENWILVAVYYRRKGLYEFALQVTMALQEVLCMEGTQEKDLKPVFLILSQCHYDIAKQLDSFSSSNKAHADMHMAHAVKWLQKLYGTSSELPEAMTELPNDSLTSLGELSDNYRKTFARRSLADTSTLNDLQLPSLRIQVLESEVDDLQQREERDRVSVKLATAAKRKADDLLSDERSKRRRLEKKLDQAEADLVKRKKLNEFAYEQLRREVESRRKAEEELEKIKRWSMEQQASTKQQAIKSTLNDLALLFEAAAHSPVSVSVKLALQEALAQSDSKSAPSSSTSTK